MKRFSKELKAFPAILFLVVIFYFTGCPIRLFTGVSCLGCGMTRAWLQLLQFHWGQAFAMHPLVLLPAFYVACYVMKKYGYEKLYKVACVIMIVAFVVVYFIRMFDPNNTVVVFKPSEGLIAKAFFKVFGH